MTGVGVPTSADRLEEMLRQGTISQDDYARLKDAMGAAPAAPEHAPFFSARPRRLYKSWHNRQLGGVCAGIAAHLNMDPLIIRILFFAAFIASGGAALLAYIAIYLMLPWDVTGTPEESAVRFPWSMALAAAASTALNWLIVHFTMTTVVNSYEQGGRVIPLRSAFSLIYRELFSNAGAVLQVLVFGALLFVYLLLPGTVTVRRRARKSVIWAYGISSLIVALYAVVLSVYAP